MVGCWRQGAQLWRFKVLHVERWLDCHRTANRQLNAVQNTLALDRDKRTTPLPIQAAQKDHTTYTRISLLYVERLNILLVVYGSNYQYILPQFDEVLNSNVVLRNSQIAAVNSVTMCV